jgi:hypothetical protein
MWPAVSGWCWWSGLCAWRGATRPRGTAREVGGRAAPWLLFSDRWPGSKVWPAVSCWCWWSVCAREGGRPGAVLPVLGSGKTVGDENRGRLLSPATTQIHAARLACDCEIRPATPEQWPPTSPASGMPSSGDTRLLYEPALPLILARGMAVMSCLGEGAVASGWRSRASGGPWVPPTGQDKASSLRFPSPSFLLSYLFPPLPPASGPDSKP